MNDIRVYALARKLNADPKRVLSLCAKLGFEAKNQLSKLNPVQIWAIRSLIGSGEDPGDGFLPTGVPSWKPPSSGAGSISLNPPDSD
jgi:hypothetical protein